MLKMVVLLKVLIIYCGTSAGLCEPRLRYDDNDEEEDDDIDNDDENDDYEICMKHVII